MCSIRPKLLQRENISTMLQDCLILLLLHQRTNPHYQCYYGVLGYTLWWSRKVSNTKRFWIINIHTIGAESHWPKGTIERHSLVISEILNKVLQEVLDPTRYFLQNVHGFFILPVTNYSKLISTASSNW